MKFKNTKEYPNAITCETSELDALKAKGWSVSMNTKCYANFIGFCSGDIEIGFGCWMHNLGADVCGSTSGGEIVAESNIKIKSQKDLNDFCKMIDMFISLSKK